MKKMFILLLALMMGLSASAQLIAKVMPKEDIQGICDKNEIYALISSFKGQEEAVCPVSTEAILKRLNTEVGYLKENPNYKGKAMIGIMINCKGEVVSCKMSINTKSAELDKQIESVFNSLGSWKAGKLNGKEVDSSQLFTFKIKNGEFTFD